MHNLYPHACSHPAPWATPWDQDRKERVCVLTNSIMCFSSPAEGRKIRGLCLKDMSSHTSTDQKRYWLFLLVILLLACPFPDLLPAKAAVGKAAEEAGVRVSKGRHFATLDDHSASARVEVFAFKLDQQLEDWPQRDRQRRWVSFDEATTLNLRPWVQFALEHAKVSPNHLDTSIVFFFSVLKK